MANSYFTLEHEGQSKVTEKMSRFLGFAVTVTDPEEAKAVIRDYRNRYHDARHLCWAYTIGEERELWQLNDNGEPSGTAGKPILGQINSLDLTNVLVMVVRYFGGIKLGTSGLTVAYRTAAREALEDGGKVLHQRKEELAFTFPYMSMNDVMKIVKSHPAVSVREQQFDNTCSMRIAVELNALEEIRNRLSSTDGITF
ncbi:MAG: YigZ family protein [Muribaculaceae bacterium]|nr:YigZ family protein [Muribaculaceae bacterium]